MQDNGLVALAFPGDTGVMESVLLTWLLVISSVIAVLGTMAMVAMARDN